MSHPYIGYQSRIFGPFNYHFGWFGMVRRLSFRAAFQTMVLIRRFGSRQKGGCPLCLCRDFASSCFTRAGAFCDSVGPVSSKETMTENLEKLYTRSTSPEECQLLTFSSLSISKNGGSRLKSQIWHLFQCFQATLALGTVKVQKPIPTPVAGAVQMSIQPVQIPTPLGLTSGEGQHWRHRKSWFKNSSE